MCRALLLRQKTGGTPRSRYEVATQKTTTLTWQPKQTRLRASRASEATTHAVLLTKLSNPGARTQQTHPSRADSPGTLPVRDATRRTGGAALASTAGGRVGTREAEEAVRATRWRPNRIGSDARFGSPLLLPWVSQTSPGPQHGPNAPMPMPGFVSYTRCQSPCLSALKPQALRLPQLPRLHTPQRLARC